MAKAKQMFTEQHALKPVEMSDVLNFNIQNNKFLESKGHYKISVDMVGDSGLGKTSLAKQVTEGNHLGLVKLNLAMIEELGDLVGYPVRQYRGTKDGNYRWLDEPALDFFVNKLGWELTGEHQMGYLPPHWIANKTSGGVLLIDDWTRGDQRFVQAVMELILTQEYISWKLPEGWHIILTSNPDDGTYHVNSTDPAQRSRYIKQHMKFDIENWAEWAEEAGIDGRCINFFLMNPEIVKQNKEVNPRSVTMFFNSISSIQNFEDPKSLAMITLMGQGSVGSEIAVLFSQFINNKLDKLMTPEEIFDPKRDERNILNKLHGIMYDGQNYRADIAYVMSTRIVNYVKLLAKNNDIEKSLVSRITSIFSKDKDANKNIFATDIASQSVTQIFSSSNRFQSMLLNKDLVNYISK
jgi:hypothetical protein